MTNGQERIYVLDTNVFVEAYRRYYAFDICPGFWDCLIHFTGDDRVLSIDRVKAEIENGDQLAEWVDDAPSELFVSSRDQVVADEFAEMMSWVQGNDQFHQAAKATFAQAADGWLAAYTKALGGVLVTQEAYAAEARNKVPLPNVCREFQIDYRDTFEMLRDLEALFNWR